MSLRKYKVIFIFIKFTGKADKNINSLIYDYPLTALTNLK